MDELLALALLPVIGDVFYLIRLPVPDKQARLASAFPEPGKHLDSLIQVLEIMPFCFRDMPVPARLRVKALLLHFSTYV